MAATEGWHIFVSTAAISLYTNGNTFVLGLIAGNTAVGYFSAADKLVRAVQGLLSPVSQAIYPHISSLAVRSREAAVEFVRKSLRWMGLFSFLMSILLLILAEPLVRLFLGDGFGISVTVLRVMAFLPFIVALSNVFGMQTMLPFGMKKLFSKIIVSAGLVSLLLIIPLSYMYGPGGAALAVLLTEILITLVMGITLQMKGFDLFCLRKQAA